MFKSMPTGSVSATGARKSSTRVMSMRTNHDSHMNTKWETKHSWKRLGFNRNLPFLALVLIGLRQCIQMGRSASNAVREARNALVPTRTELFFQSQNASGQDASGLEDAIRIVLLLSLDEIQFVLLISIDEKL